MIEITGKFNYFQWYSAAFLVSVIVLRVVFDALYITYIHSVWPHKGFGFEWCYLKYIESWLIYILVVVMLPRILKHPSDLFVHILGLGLLLPMTSMYGLAGEPRWIIYSVIFGFIVIMMTRRGGLPDCPTLESGHRIVVYLSIMMVAIVIGWIFASGSVSFMNFDLRKVYEYRRDVGELINKGLFSYLNIWVFKVFNLFLFAYFLHKRFWVLVVVIFGIQLFFFSVSAHKSVLFYPFMVLAIWVFFRKGRALIVIPLGLLFVVTFSALLWRFTDYDLPASLFIRRIFYVVANNVYDYYHFFSEDQRVYWSNSITSTLMDYPYALNYPYVIGEYQALMMDREGTNAMDVYANSSFMATGYMHAGFAGLIIYCLIVGFLFRLTDILTYRGTPMWFAMAVTVIPMFSLLLSADLPTALLTNGIAISLILLFLIRNLFSDDDWSVKSL